MGLRGVGKTVLLNRLHNDAQAKGLATVLLEAPEQRSLPALLAPHLRAVLLRLDRLARGAELTKRALRALGGFVQAAKLKYQDIEFGLDLGIEPGVADTGALDADLTSLFQVVGEAARDSKTVVALFIDELQYVAEAELQALITALHRCAQLQLPVTLIGAGLPQLPGQLGKARECQILRGAALRIQVYRQAHGSGREARPHGARTTVRGGVLPGRLASDPRSHRVLSLFPPGVGQAHLELRQLLAGHP